MKNEFIKIGFTLGVIFCLFFMAGAAFAQSESDPEGAATTGAELESEALANWQKTQWDPAEEHATYLAQEHENIERERRALLLIRADVRREIERMERLRRQLEVDMVQMDEGREKRIKKLVKVFQAMPSQDVVPLLDNLNEKMMLNVLFRMKEKKQSQILALMEPERAAEISRKMIETKN
jgi:flagellar motility protein MotE (MotC chaperone)